MNPGGENIIEVCRIDFSREGDMVEVPKDLDPPLSREQFRSILHETLDTVEEEVSENLLVFIKTEMLEISPEWCEKVFHELDKMIFGGLLYQQVGGKIAFKLSTRQKSSGGSITCSRGVTIIRMSRYYVDNWQEGKWYRVNRKWTQDKDVAFLQILLHEITHLIEWLAHRRTGHGKNFKTISYILFGHRVTYHELSRPFDEIPQSIPPKNTIHLGHYFTLDIPNIG